MGVRKAKHGWILTLVFFHHQSAVCISDCFGNYQLL